MQASGNAADTFMAGADGGVFEWKADSDMLARFSQYGELSLQDDGQYSFRLDGGLPAGQVTLALPYAFEDADGNSIQNSIFLDIQGA